MSLYFTASSAALCAQHGGQLEFGSGDVIAAWRWRLYIRNGVMKSRRFKSTFLLLLKLLKKKKKKLSLIIYFLYFLRNIKLYYLGGSPTHNGSLGILRIDFIVIDEINSTRIEGYVFR